MSDRSRTDDLERRVQQDPASIAFAQLAEEHRRAGEFEAAVRVCRTGLAQHPSYLSARVTLGRALLELHRYDEARTELEYVLHASPENTSAARALAEIDRAAGRLDEDTRRAAASVHRQDLHTGRGSREDGPIRPSRGDWHRRRWFLARSGR